ncbi:Transcriptional regulator, LysR family [hydrothermal vent metagenome]|uniref:Transcriptional regulator, LysR family n=1 Tax=hydrothermal vent metagenome TaxID=652676 RepID=A0A3B0TY53_9ZZZZ
MQLIHFGDSKIMATPLDLDQIQSFCIIADCASFTKAARRVNKTQSAVSMQIKRLEERLGQALFSREGRTVTLTAHGQELYVLARKMLRTNAQIVDLFNGADLTGRIRFGVPDDYAVRLLPVILSQFQKTHPKIAVDVKCMASEELLSGMHSGDFDLVVFTQGTQHEFGEVFRTEKIHWVGLKNGTAANREPVPMAMSDICCRWRSEAIEGLNRSNKNFRIAYTSANATAIISAVLSDLAVGVLPESAMQPGLVILGEKEGFPRMQDAQIAVMRASHAYGGIYDALREHIVESLGNIDRPEPLNQQAAE